MADKSGSDEQQKAMPGNMRTEAEKALADFGRKGPHFEGGDVHALFQELQVYQIELEMQNDELIKANEELELQQLKFSGIYNLAPIGYFILDEGGFIEEVNNAGISLLAIGKSGILHRRLQSFVASAHSDLYYRFFRQLLSVNSRQSCQLKMVSTTGREFYARVEGIAINPTGTKRCQCYLAVIDITANIEAEQNLAETKERLEMALDASQACTWELDLETMRFYFNDVNFWIKPLANTFDNQYQSFLQLIHPDDREAADQHFRISVNHDREIDLDCRMLNNENEICYVSLRGRLVDQPEPTARFVGIIMDITEKKKAADDTARLKADQQRNITLAALNTQESERKRISDALHDSVSQLLYGIKMQLGMLGEGRNAKSAAEGINNLLDLAIRETRNISFELAPSILSDFGLPATLNELAKRLSTPRMKINCKITGLNERLEPELENGIFRIIQELVNNCMKHADASVINLEVKRNKSIEIRVQDNGRGFDVKREEVTPAGSGLSSIRNRLNLYRGSMQIDSAAGKGTSVKMYLQY